MIWLAILFVFVSSYNEFAFFSLFPFITDQFEKDPEVSIMYFLLLLNAIHNIGRIFGFAIYRYFVAKISKESLMNGCFALSCLVYIFYGFSNSILWLAISRFLIGMTCPNYEIMKKYFKEMTRTSEENTYSILMTLVEKAGSIGGLLISSYLYFYKIPGTEQYPLLTLSIVSAIMLFCIFLVHCLCANNRIRINCLCKCNDEHGIVRFYSDDSDDDIHVRRERDHDPAARNLYREQADTKPFIMNVVYFSSLYNTYRYLVVIYLYWNRYDVTDIGNIMAITEAGGLIFGFIVSKIAPSLTNLEKYVYPTIFLILAGIISFFPFIMQITPQSSNLQMGIIILTNGFIEILYGLILTLNNTILKKYRLNTTRWSVYSWATILTNVISILFITLITILMSHTKDNEYKYTPFYSISSMFGLFIIIFVCCKKQITQSD